MNITEIAKDLNNTYKTEREKNLEKKILELEKIIENLANRLDYLESKCNWIFYKENR